MKTQQPKTPKRAKKEDNDLPDWALRLKEQGRPYAKVLRVLNATNPLEEIDKDDLVFAIAILMGKTALQAAREAKPKLTDASIRDYAYETKARPDVQLVMKILEEEVRKKKDEMSKQKIESFVADRLEVEMFLTRGMRASLGELDESSPLVVEKSRTLNNNGVHEKIRKVDPVKCAQVLVQLNETEWVGKKEQPINLTINQILQQIVSPGLPQSGGIVDEEALLK